MYQALDTRVSIVDASCTTYTSCVWSMQSCSMAVPRMLGGLRRTDRTSCTRVSGGGAAEGRRKARGTWRLRLTDTARGHISGRRGQSLRTNVHALQHARGLWLQTARRGGKYTAWRRSWLAPDARSGARSGGTSAPAPKKEPRYAKRPPDGPVAEQHGITQVSTQARCRVVIAQQVVGGCRPGSTRASGGRNVSRNVQVCACTSPSTLPLRREGSPPGPAISQQLASNQPAISQQLAPPEKSARRGDGRGASETAGSATN